ncbi:maleylpyruvate isomerase N-terminal domain-containing protein [Kitasatospora sp. NPDC048365]|uniref:maleylpyruvate isomerase N-terminal domain-containing protein n=1 Tax=Kitasatospora sp. NPDC048365 TaxID=3364050 RepID=UPI0037141513
MDGGDVGRAVGWMTRTLGPYAVGDDWAVPARGLEWSCRETAAHVAHDLVAYAGQLAGRADGSYLPYDLVVGEGATPTEVLRVVAAAGGMLRAVLDTAPADARAWHWGPCDPGGFAAMGCAEVLLHTWDLAGGLGADWSPPPDLCEGVLARLFPDAPAGDPAAVLLWCAGRGELPGRPRRTTWSWRAAVPD